MLLDDPTLDALVRGAVLAALFLVWVLVLTRLIGLRAFSKMAALDFVATVATGSLLATAATSTSWRSYLQAVAAVTALFALQFAFAKCRQRFERFRSLVDNTPKVLVRDGVVDEEMLRETRVCRDDLRAKMREANAKRFDEVRYVVLETTGDISVLHGESVDGELVDQLG